MSTISQINSLQNDLLRTVQLAPAVSSVDNAFSEIYDRVAEHSASAVAPYPQDLVSNFSDGVMERAIDADGQFVRGLFRMRYNDGTFSEAGSVNEIDALRRQALDKVAPSKTVATAEYLSDLSNKVIANNENLTAIDITDGPQEMLGNDMVMLSFEDNSRVLTQKALYEAAEGLGAFEAIRSQQDFSDWHQNTWASAVSTDEKFAAAHEAFNTAQIQYNSALLIKNPNIAYIQSAILNQYL